MLVHEYFLTFSFLVKKLMKKLIKKIFEHFFLENFFSENETKLFTF